MAKKASSDKASTSLATTTNGKSETADTKSSTTKAKKTTQNVPQESARSTLWFSVIRFSALSLPFILLAYFSLLYVQYSQLPPYDADPYFDSQLNLLKKKSADSELDKFMKSKQVIEVKSESGAVERVIEDSGRFLSSDSSSYIYERVKYSENYKEKGVNGIIIFVHNIGSHQGAIIDEAEESEWIEKSLILKNGFIIYRYDMRGSGKSSGPRCFIVSSSNSTAFEYLNDFHQVVGERMNNLKENLEIGQVPIVVISESLGSLITLHYETSYPNKHKIDGLTFVSLPSITSTQYTDERSFDKAPGKILPPHKDVLMRMTLHYVPSYPARSLLPPLNYTCRVAKRIKKLTSDKLRYSGASIFAETQLYNLINSFIYFSSYEEVHKSIRSDSRYSIKGVGGVELMVNPDMWTITTAKTILDLLEKVNQGETLTNLKNPNILLLHGVYDYVTPIANLRRIEYLSKRNCPDCQRKVIDYDKSMLDLLNDMQSEKVKLDIENWLNQIIVK